MLREVEGVTVKTVSYIRAMGNRLGRWYPRILKESGSLTLVEGDRLKMISE